MKKVVALLAALLLAIPVWSFAASTPVTVTNGTARPVPVAVQGQPTVRVNPEIPVTVQGMVQVDPEQKPVPVSVKGTAAVSVPGGVAVTNTVPVNIQNEPNVSVPGGVAVINGDSYPVPVKLQTGPRPYTRLLEGSIPAGYANDYSDPLTLPTGKVFKVTSAMVWASADCRFNIMSSDTSQPSLWFNTPVGFVLANQPQTINIAGGLILAPQFTMVNLLRAAGAASTLPVDYTVVLSGELLPQ